MDHGKRRTSGSLVVAGMAFFLLCGGALAAPLGPKEAWQKGTEYAGNKLYIDAVDYYTRAIRTNKGEIPMGDVARIFNSRGLAYQGLGNMDKALDDFSNAIELDDRNPEFFMNRATARLDRKDYDRARDDFGAVIARDPRRADAFSGRGRANLETGSFDAAIADFRRLLDLQPRSVGALYGIGLAYKKKGEDAKAIEAFNDLLKIDPRFAAASYQNAGLYSRSGKIDAACVWLEEAAANGYRDWDAMKNDSNFDALRKSTCFGEIVSKRR